MHLGAFAVDKNKQLIGTTFYNIEKLSKISKMLKGKDEDLLYYKNSYNIDNKQMNMELKKA